MKKVIIGLFLYCGIGFSLFGMDPRSERDRRNIALGECYQTLASCGQEDQELSRLFDRLEGYSKEVFGEEVVDEETEGSPVVGLEPYCAPGRKRKKKKKQVPFELKSREEQTRIWRAQLKEQMRICWRAQARRRNSPRERKRRFDALVRQTYEHFLEREKAQNQGIPMTPDYAQRIRGLANRSFYNMMQRVLQACGVRFELLEGYVKCFNFLSGIEEDIQNERKVLRQILDGFVGRGSYTKALEEAFKKAFMVQVRKVEVEALKTLGRIQEDRELIEEFMSKVNGEFRQPGV